MAGMELRKFSQDEIYISKEDAYAILRFYFHDVGVLQTTLSDQDVQFAQGLLLEGVDRSYEFGLVKLIFDNFYMKAPRDFTNLYDMVKKFTKQAAKAWWNHATEKDLAEPKIYEYVRNQIQANFITVWKIRVQTGEM